MSLSAQAIGVLIALPTLVLILPPLIYVIGLFSGAATVEEIATVLVLNVDARVRKGQSLTLQHQKRLDQLRRTAGSHTHQARSGMEWLLLAILNTGRAREERDRLRPALLRRVAQGRKQCSRNGRRALKRRLANGAIAANDLLEREDQYRDALTRSEHRAAAGMLYDCVRHLRTIFGSAVTPGGVLGMLVGMLVWLVTSSDTLSTQAAPDFGTYVIAGGGWGSIAGLLFADAQLAWSFVREITAVPRWAVAAFSAAFLASCVWQARILEHGRVPSPPYKPPASTPGGLGWGEILFFVAFLALTIGFIGWPGYQMSRHAVGPTWERTRGTAQMLLGASFALFVISPLLGLKNIPALVAGVVLAIGCGVSSAICYLMSESLRKEEREQARMLAMEAAQVMPPQTPSTDGDES